MREVSSNRFVNAHHVVLERVCFMDCMHVCQRKSQPVCKQLSHPVVGVNRSLISMSLSLCSADFLVSCLLLGLSKAQSRTGPAV